MMRALSTVMILASLITPCPASAAGVTAKAATAEISTARAEAAVDKLLAVTGVSKQMNAIGPQIIDALMPMLVRGNVGKEEEIQAILREEFLTIFAGMTPDLVAHARTVYLQHFSAEELEEIVAFYESPIGAKMTRETPAITSEMFRYGQQAGRAAVAGAMPHIIDRMRAAKLAVPSGT